MPLLLVDTVPTTRGSKAHDTIVDMANPNAICSRAVVVSGRLTMFVSSSLTAHDALNWGVSIVELGEDMDLPKSP